MTRAFVALNLQYQLAGPTQKGQLLSQLIAAAATRQQLLVALVEDDPAEVLRLALPATLRAGLPPAVQALVEQEVEAEGVLEVLHEDRHSGSRYLYFLDTAAERLSLHFRPIRRTTSSRALTSVCGASASTRRSRSAPAKATSRRWRRLRSRTPLGSSGRSSSS